MYDIYFYRDSRGISTIADYINELEAKGDKDSRIKLNKIRDYVMALAVNGTMLPDNYCKHIEGDIWELRPIRDRILFAACFNGAFVLLHVFMKQTQKTPRREIDRAKSELIDFKKRWNSQ